MKKAPCYKGGGSVKDTPNKPKVPIIDRSKYSYILDKPMSGTGTNMVSNDTLGLSPEILKSSGYNLVSGSGKNAVYEKGGNYHVINEQPNAKENRYGLINIGNGSDPILNTSITPSPVIPSVDPNHKPLDFSNPNMVYDPNTGSYKNPTTGSTINPIVEQYSKGGKVRKAPIRGYDAGGAVEKDPFNNSYNSAIANVNQKNQDQITADNQAKRNAQLKQGADTAGKALGAYGTAYYATNPGDNSGEQTRSATLGAVSNTGTAGGIIGGIAAIGDKIGKPIKTRSERTDDTGELVDPTAAKRNAVIGSLFSPSKALAFRSQYKGGWTDVSGNGYLKYLENQAKGKINEQRQADIDTDNAAKASTGKVNFDAALQARNDNQDFTNDNLYKSTNPQALLDVNTNRTSSQYGGKSWLQRTFKDGGTIKGSGTGKSDSIKAKVVPGSFIVPAENSKVAEELREKVLRKSPKKKANLDQDDGQSVKLSNGEHMFSPEEKSELETYGYDVDALAPNSDDKDNLKNGGLTSEKVKIMLKDNQANGKPLTSAQKKYFGWIAGGSKANGGEVEGYKDGGGVKTKSERDKIAAEEEALRKAKENQVNKNKSLSINKNTLKRQDEASKRLIEADSNLKSLEKQYQDYNKRIPYARSTTNDKGALDKFDERTRIEKKALLDKIDQATQARESANKEYRQSNFKSDSNIDNNVSDVSKGGLNYLGAGNKINNLSKINPSVTDYTPSVDVKSTTGNKKYSGVNALGKQVVTADKLNTLPASAIPYPAQTESLYGDRTPAEIARMNQTPVLNTDVKTNNVIPSGNEVATPTTTPTVNVNDKKNKYDYGNILGNAINYGIPIAQTAIGLNQLKKAGPRPVDGLDADYTNSLNQLRGGVQQGQDQAKYGFTGQQLTDLQNQNTNLTNAGRYAARNFSGGSSGNALNMERSVINDSFGRNLQTSVNDKNLQLQKQQEAFQRQQILNGAIQDKQDRLRQYFGDDLNAFHQKTQSAAALTNMGLTNLLDGYRADQRLNNFKDNTQTQ